jgi:hypothetical protein
VTSRLTIRGLFAAILGAAVALTPASRLAAAPSDAPVTRHDMVMPVMDDSRDGETAMSVSDDADADMPCCPHDAPMPVDCDKCIFMASCIAKCFSGLATTTSYLLPLRSAVIVVQRDAMRLPSIGRPPPEHPPRHLV